MPLSSSPSMLDADQCIRQSYDDGSKSLKITVVGETLPSGGGIEVNINSAQDSVAIANAAGTPLVINADGSINTVGEGLNAFKVSRYTIGTSATQLVAAALTNRKSISVKVITTSSADIVYLNTTNAVSSSNGYFLFNGDTVQLDITPSQTIWAIATSSGQIVAVLEVG